MWLTQKAKFQQKLASKAALIQEVSLKKKSTVTEYSSFENVARNVNGKIYIWTIEYLKQYVQSVSQLHNGFIGLLHTVVGEK